MKKITLLALLLAAMPTALLAQDCPAASAPYLLDFETATVPAIPDCTTQSIGFGPQWTTVNNPGHGFSNVTLQRGPSVEPSESWFYTQGIELTPGTYRLSYRYGNDSSTTTEKLRSVFVTDPTAPVISYIGTHDAVTGGEPVEFSFGSPLTVSQTTTYYIGFNAYSDPNQGTLYVDNISIQQLTCGAPQAINVTNVRATTATISWLPQTGPVTIGYFYGVSTTNTPPANFRMTPNLTTDISDLEPNTTYYAFASTLCGNTTSEWISTSFTTPCATATAPYLQDFETAAIPAIPACNTQTGAQWETVNNPGHGFTNATLQRGPSAEGSESWFYTQGIELTPGTYRLSYRYGNDSTTTTEKLRSAFVTDTSAPVESYIATHNAITGGQPVDYSFENPVTVSETTTFYFGFNAFSDPGQGTLYVDNISVQQLVCSAPTAISVTNITATTATISWMPGNSPITIGYFYGVSTTDTPPTNFQMTPNLTRDIADLQPNTTYYAFVSTLCGNPVSEWISIPFTTPCAAAVPPYTLDFESDITVPAIPECTNVAGFERGNEWQTATAPGHGFDSNVLHYPDSDEPANAWFFTQGIQLQAGTAYRFSYKYGNDSTTTTERLRTIMATSPTRPEEDAQLTYFGDHTTITGGNPVEFSYGNPITISTTGIYYFGFNIYSTSEQGDLYVDNIKVQEWVCNVPQAITVNNIGTTTATINWEAQTEPTSLGYYYAYNTTNTPPTDMQMSMGFSANLENLTPNTTYYAFARSFCGATFSEWISVPFTTLSVLGINDIAFAGFKAYPNPVSNILTLENTTVIEKVEVYNVTGQLVLTQNVKNANAQINVEKLAPGAYLLNVYAGGVRKNVRFIKQ